MNLDPRGATFSKHLPIPIFLSDISEVFQYEHAFDLLFEFSWLIALALFLFTSSESALPLVLCLFSILFMAFYRYCYDIFSRAMNTSLDNYGSFERVFRRVAGRRNLYNIHILLGVLLRIPLYSMISILGHSALTAVVY